MPPIARRFNIQSPGFARLRQAVSGTSVTPTGQVLDRGVPVTPQQPTRQQVAASTQPPSPTQPTAPQPIARGQQANTFTTPSGAIVTAGGQLVSGPPQAQNQPLATQRLQPQPTPQVSPIQRSEPQFMPSAIDPQIRALRQQVGTTFQPTEEEIDIENRLTNILTDVEAGQERIRTQAIPTPFLRGQAAGLARQAELQAAPLQRQLALLQGRREAEREAGLVELGFAEQDEERIREEREEFQERQEEQQDELFDIASSLVNAGGTRDQIQQILQAPDTASAIQLAAATGLLGAPESEVPTQIVEANGRQLLVNTQTGEQIADLGAAPARQQDGTGVTPGEQFAAERAARTIQNVDELLPRVNSSVVGSLTALTLSRVPGTDAADFRADLDTLKSNIAFGELTEMRNASRTGGALGQVSNIELGLLESTLGALSISQSPENFRRNLNKIRESLQRWNETKQGIATGQPVGDGGTDDIDAFLDSI